MENINLFVDLIYRKRKHPWTKKDINRATRAYSPRWRRERGRFERVISDFTGNSGGSRGVFLSGSATRVTSGIAVPDGLDCENR